MIQAPDGGCTLHTRNDSAGEKRTTARVRILSRGAHGLGLRKREDRCRRLPVGDALPGEANEPEERVDRAGDQRPELHVERVGLVGMWHRHTSHWTQTAWNGHDGSPNRELVWHYDYGTSGATENRLTAIHLPSNCSDYDESSAPYSVTLRSSDGVMYALDYDYATDTYDGYVEKIQVQEGAGGTAVTLTAFGRVDSTRPDLATSVTRYETTGEQDGRTTSLAYSFYDSGGAKVQLKQRNSSAVCNATPRQNVKIGKLAPWALRWYARVHAAGAGQFG